MPLLFHTNDEYDRQVAVYAPRRWATYAASGNPLPILLAFHGGNGNVVEFANQTAGFHTVSIGDATGTTTPVPDEDLFITVYVGGTGFYTAYAPPGAPVLNGQGFDAGNIGGAILSTAPDEIKFVEDTLALVTGWFNSRLPAHTPRRSA